MLQLHRAAARRRVEGDRLEQVARAGDALVAAARLDVHADSRRLRGQRAGAGGGARVVEERGGAAEELRAAASAARTAPPWSDEAKVRPLASLDTCGSSCADDLPVTAGTLRGGERDRISVVMRAGFAAHSSGGARRAKQARGAPCGRRRTQGTAHSAGSASAGRRTGAARGSAALARGGGARMGGVGRAGSNAGGRAIDAVKEEGTQAEDVPPEPAR